MRATVEEILQAAEQSEIPNTNDTFIEYKDNLREVAKACVIGAAAIEFGRDTWSDLEWALHQIKVEATVDDLPYHTNLSELITHANRNDVDRSVATQSIRDEYPELLDRIVEF